jgi:hypothetical protein
VNCVVPVVLNLVEKILTTPGLGMQNKSEQGSLGRRDEVMG